MTAFGLLLATLVGIEWQDLSRDARAIAAQLGLQESTFHTRLTEIRSRNQARLQQGERDHLVYYMLQATDFTSEAPIDPAAAAAESRSDSRITARIRDLRRALKSPSDERQRYFATLLPLDLEAETVRVLDWIRTKERGCVRSASPQTCIAELYQNRGHSSDTSRDSMPAVTAAFRWLKANRGFDAKRVLIVGPGSDFAPRTALKAGPVATYQPGAVRKLTGAEVHCVDLNPRVVRAASGECAKSIQGDMTVEHPHGTYDAIIATNVLLYFDQTELFLALHNVRAMLRPGGVLIHNDARFEANAFGRATDMPVLHFGSVTLDAHRQPPLVDRFVIHHVE